MGKIRKSVLYNPTKQIVSVCPRYPSFVMMLTRRVDYDQYYASLAASNAPSAQDTPALTNFGEFGEEDEDVKPNVEYLDSLNEYRKRSRSLEDNGLERGPSKTPKLNGHSPTNGFAPPVPEPEPELPSIPLEEPAPEEALDDPIVYGKFFCVHL